MKMQLKLQKKHRKKIKHSGGIAFGFDRLCALFLGLDSIRDVIAFPKNNSGRDVMIDTPSEISKEQLDELNILIAHKLYFIIQDKTINERIRKILSLSLEKDDSDRHIYEENAKLSPFKDISILSVQENTTATKINYILKSYPLIETLVCFEESVFKRLAGFKNVIYLKEQNDRLLIELVQLIVRNFRLI